MTDAERKLWSKLRNRQLNGLKFKRQVPIGSFVVDFACLEHHLVVEVGGGQHNRTAGLRRDADRSVRLEAMGYLVLRFWNHDVSSNIEGVVEAILNVANNIGPVTPHPVPLPTGERGRRVPRRVHAGGVTR